MCDAERAHFYPRVERRKPDKIENLEGVAQGGAAVSIQLLGLRPLYINRVAKFCIGKINSAQTREEGRDEGEREVERRGMKR